jgi:hypothetical protein
MKQPKPVLSIAGVAVILAILACGISFDGPLPAATAVPPTTVPPAVSPTSAAAPSAVPTSAPLTAGAPTSVRHLQPLLPLCQHRLERNGATGRIWAE